MSDLRAVKIKDSISTRLTKITLSIYFLLFITVTAIHVGVEYIYVKKSVEHELEVIERTFEPSIAKAMWDLSRKQLHAITEGMVNLPQVVGVVVEDEKNKTIITSGTEKTGGNTVADADASPPKIHNIAGNIQHRFVIRHFRAGQLIELGSGTIFSSSAVIFQRVKIGFLFVIINAMIIALALWLTFYWVGRALIIRPLADLTNTIIKTDFDLIEKREITISSKGNSELKLLGNAFSDLMKRLYHAHGALKRLNVELEKKVEERTLELSEANIMLKQRVEQHEKTMEALRVSEETLRKERDRAQNYLDIAGVIMVAIDRNEKVTLINRKGCEIFGLPEKEIIGQNWFDTFLPGEERDQMKQYFRLLTCGKAEGKEYFENRIMRHTGELRTIAWHNTTLKDPDGHIHGTLSSGEDITVRQKSERLIRESLEEKDVLLKEIHHRVKNNMQIIQSLLSIQADKIDSKELKQPLVESNNRIKSMALIHETLYRSEDIAKLDLKTYFQNIADHLTKAYTNPSQKLDLSIKVHPIKLNMDYCIACGLILNELISNAIKYAFTGQRCGKLIIELIDRNGEEVELSIADDGQGLPDTVDLASGDSMGLRIVRILVEGQLKGTISADNKDGTTFMIRFPLPKTKQD